MKPFFLAVMIICVASSALASDVAVSVSVGQPGFYGRIDIGSAPRPELIYSQPLWFIPFLPVLPISLSTCTCPPAMRNTGAIIAIDTMLWAPGLFRPRQMV